MSSIGFDYAKTTVRRPDIPWVSISFNNVGDVDRAEVHCKACGQSATVLFTSDDMNACAAEAATEAEKHAVCAVLTPRGQA